MVKKIDMDRVHNLMTKEDIDVLLASSPANVYYITDMPSGYTSPNRLLYTVKDTTPTYGVIPVEEDPKLIITNAAAELAGKHAWIKDQRTYSTGVYIVRPAGKLKDYGTTATEALITTLKEVRNHKRIAVEKDRMSVSLLEILEKSLPNTKIIDGSPLFRQLRMIKTPEEIRRFREATRICCKVISKVVDSIEKGVSEKDLVTLLQTTILREGGDSWHQTTIAIGPENGPNIYNQPSDRKVADGDVIRVDVGCVFDGYTADLARTIVFGRVPEEAREIYGAVKSACDQGIAAMKPGVKTSDIHKIIRDVVRQRYDVHYTRGNVGHGVGVELYDEPMVTEENSQQLMPGMTMSIEAPYHKFGLGGLIVEDSILITEDGHEVVSDINRGLFTV